jgi:pimeloyl-ACP methyl ester carboxylesterase
MKSVLAPLALVVLAGCSSSSSDSPGGALSPSNDKPSADQPADQPAGDGAQTTPCRYIVPKSVEGTTVKCYDVLVPENRAKDNGRKVKLHVAVFPGKKELPPTFELIGGPGGGGDPMVGMLAAGEMREVEELGFLRDRGDYVIFDQRGVGRSEPNLSCASEMFSAAMSSTFTSIMTKCRDRLVGEGIDLGAYTTYDNALDVDDIRKALGYQKMDLHAISYGTLLALEIMRHRPDAVHTVIIDGVVPPEAHLISDTPRTIDENLTRIFAGCAAQNECKTAFPDLEGSLAALQQKMSEKPLQADGTSMDWYDFIGMVGQSMYEPGGIKRIPLWINDFNARGDAAFADFLKAEEAMYAEEGSPPTPLVSEVYKAMQALDGTVDGEKYLGMNDGMYTSVTCSDSGQYEDLDTALNDLKKLRPAFQEVEQTKEQFAVCALWPKSEKRPTTKQAVTSDLPTLVMGGQYDPVTPSYWAEQVAKTLSKSQFVLENGLGHGSMDACARQQKAAFLNDPSAKVDTTCSSERSLSFLTSFTQGSAFHSAKRYTTRPKPVSIASGIRPNVIVRPIRILR